MIVSRDEMNEYLHRGECQVKFTKVNGDERLMRCTLKDALMPKWDAYEKKYQIASEERLIVWDLDKEAFRSFNLSSIIWVMAPEKE